MKRAYRQAYELGIDAREEEIIVDARASSKFSSWQHGVCPTITRRRAAAGAFWVPTRGRYLTVKEMARLFGYYNSDMAAWPLKRNKLAICHMLGNSVPVHMMQAVLSSALRAVGAC